MPFIINDYVSHFFYEGEAPLKKNLGASTIIFFYNDEQLWCTLGVHT